MEPIKNESASKIPAFLVYSTMTFLILRLMLFGFDMHFSKAGDQNVKSAIAWVDLTEKFREKVAKEYSVLRTSDDSKKTELCKSCRLERKLDKSIAGESPFSLEEEVPELLSTKEQPDKLIIYEFFSPLSDPCRTMEESALSNSQVKDLIDKNFIAARVTYKNNENAVVGKSLVDFRRKYGVCAFPTLVIVDDKGEMVANLVGNCSSLTTYRFLSRTVASKKNS